MKIQHVIICDTLNARSSDTIIDCGLTLEAPENGYAHVPCTRLGCTATYWCRSGYSLVGDLDSTRTCQANGYWSNYTPACQRDYY